MTPFPEAEIMTIKRLEVALRKMDYKLLKDGAYKLHEKYHAGYKFEYLELLKDIYIEISNNPSIPNDVKDILSPTIEDILAQGGVQADTTMSPSESLNTQKETNSLQETQGETKINAFDAFSPQKPQEIQQQNPPRYFTQSPFSAEPFRGFNLPKDEPQAIAYEEQQNQNPEYEIQEEHYQEIVKETIKEFSNIQENKEEEIRQEEHLENKTQSETQTEKKSIGILYFQDNSQEKTKNISKLKEIIAISKEKEALIDDLFALISEISTQANTNIIELQGVLSNLAHKSNSINLITNSQSAMFLELLNSINITYSFIKNENNSQLNILPLFGLSNLFVCEECKEKYLNNNQNIKPLVLECPKCKNPMYPEFYSTKQDAQINIEYYNEALVNIAKSDVLLLIHPTYCDKISIKLIESALKVSNTKEVYILDKDFNIRETYKNFILNNKPEAKIYTQGNVLEDFFSNI